MCRGWWPSSPHRLNLSQESARKVSCIGKRVEEEAQEGRLPKLLAHAHCCSWCLGARNWQRLACSRSLEALRSFCQAGHWGSGRSSRSRILRQGGKSVIFPDGAVAWHMVADEASKDLRVANVVHQRQQFVFQDRRAKAAGASRWRGTQTIDWLTMGWSRFLDWNTHLYNGGRTAQPCVHAGSPLLPVARAPEGCTREPWWGLQKGFGESLEADAIDSH